jgi:hypothetical protein
MAGLTTTVSRPRGTAALTTIAAAVGGAQLDPAAALDRLERREESGSARSWAP